MTDKTLAVILNHNLPEPTDRLYESLSPYKESDYDLMVLDNGSFPDGRSQYTSLQLEENIFWGGALNFAFSYMLDHPDYDSLLFLNNDIEVNGYNFVRSLRNELEKDAFMIVAPSVAGSAEFGGPNPWRQMLNWYSGGTREVRWIDNQAPMFHRRFIEEVRQFDEELIYGWGQELVCAEICNDYCWKIGVCDHITILHHGHRTLLEGKTHGKDSTGAVQAISFEEFNARASAAYQKYFSAWGEKLKRYVDYGNFYRFESPLLSATPTGEVSRTQIINHLIAQYGYQEYLEIGIERGNNLCKVRAPEKTSVDPEPLYRVTHQMTSDEFFASCPENQFFDLIFIDGLHAAEQVSRDIANSLAHLSENGTIVVHDCNPQSEKAQLPERTQLIWNGDVWKAFARLRTERADLEMCVVDTDWGVGIIRFGRQKLFSADYQQFDFAFLESHRKELLNLVSVEEFFNEWC